MCAECILSPYASTRSNVENLIKKNAEIFIFSGHSTIYLVHKHKKYLPRTKVIHSKHVNHVLQSYLYSECHFFQFHEFETAPEKQKMGRFGCLFISDSLLAKSVAYYSYQKKDLVLVVCVCASLVVGRLSCCPLLGWQVRFCMKTTFHALGDGEWATKEHNCEGSAVSEQLQCNTHTIFLLIHLPMAAVTRRCF